MPPRLLRGFKVDVFAPACQPLVGLGRDPGARSTRGNGGCGV